MSVSTVGMLSMFHVFFVPECGVLCLVGGPLYVGVYLQLLVCMGIVDWWPTEVPYFVVFDVF